MFPLNRPRAPSGPRAIFDIALARSPTVRGPFTSPDAIARTATTFKGLETVFDAIPASPPARRWPHGDPSFLRSGIGSRRVPTSRPTFMKYGLTVSSWPCGMRIIMSRKSAAVRIALSSTYLSICWRPLLRIFFRVLYRPVRSSMFRRFFFRRQPDSYDACNEISFDRTNAANSSNDIFPSPDWSPSSTKSCTNARGIRSDCAKRSRSSCAMKPRRRASIRLNSSRSRLSRSIHGFPLPLRPHVAFRRVLTSSHRATGIAPRSAPCTTNAFSTNPSSPV
eukprot:31442-Pelagococcus_subviridis.AAC.4